MVCRGDGGWGRAERAPSAGGWLLGLRATDSDRPSPAANAESVGGRAAGGRKKQRRLCRRKNRQSSARKALFVPPAEVQKASAVLPAKGGTLSFSRRCAKRFRRSPQESVAERADRTNRRAVGCAASSYDCPRRPSEKRRGFFCRCENFVKTEAFCAASFWPDSRKNRRPACQRRRCGYTISLRVDGRSRIRVVLTLYEARRPAATAFAAFRLRNALQSGSARAAALSRTNKNRQQIDVQPQRVCGILRRFRRVQPGLQIPAVQHVERHRAEQQADGDRSAAAGARIYEVGVDGGDQNSPSASRSAFHGKPSSAVMDGCCPKTRRCPHRTRER